MHIWDILANSAVHNHSHSLAYDSTVPTASAHNTI